LRLLCKEQLGNITHINVCGYDDMTYQTARFGHI
jgi:hypothetical protein